MALVRCKPLGVVYYIGIVMRKANCNSQWKNEWDIGLWWYDYRYVNLIYWIVKATWGGMVEYELW